MRNLKNRKGMGKMKGRLAIIISFWIISAIPLLAQEARWDVDSGHSTARLILSSSQRPAAQINVGVARVSGSVIGTDDAADPYEFDLTIYSADQDSPHLRSEDRLGGPSLPRPALRRPSWRVRSSGHRHIFQVHRYQASRSSHRSCRRSYDG